MDDDLKQQNNDGLQGSESNDRLSSLHDSILHHILSFLPTRAVVQTAILSQRWKSLSTSLSIFDIDDSYCSNRSACWNAVDRYLRLRNGSSIQQLKLRLTNDAESNYPHVQSMFSSLVSHKIQHLDLSLYVEEEFSLPCSVFDCQSLGILKLSFLKKSRSEITLELPDRISLPCLKVLFLRDFAFPTPEPIEKLLSSCPVLEEMTLVGCEWTQRNRITISIPSLKRLTMGAKIHNNFADDDGSCCIRIEAPALLSFNYTGCLTNNFYLTKISSSSSIKVFIHITRRCYGEEKSRARHLVKLLQGLGNMVSLTISNDDTKEALSLEALSLKHLVSHHLPIFHHLEYLDFDMNLKGCDLRGLLKLFYFTPNLGTIQFSKGIDQTETICKAGFRFMPKSLPNCFSSSLKILGLKKFHGDPHEFSFLNNFLEKAISVERINIYLAKDINQENQPGLRENLEKLSTSFKHCAINIVE